MPLHIIRHTIILIFLLVCYARADAQSNETMQIKYNSGYTANDTSYIMALIKASSKSEHSDIGKALLQIDAAYTLSRKKKFVKGMANSLIAYAVYAGTRGNYQSTDSLFKLAYPYCLLDAQQAKSNYMLVLWYENVSIQHSYQGNYQQALNCSFKALSLLEHYKADTALVNLKLQVYNSIGSMLQYLKETDQALSYLNVGIQLALKHNDTFNLAQLYVNAGGTYRGKQEWGKAVAYYGNAIKLARQTNNVFVLQVAYLSMAALYRNKKDDDSALIYLNKAGSLTSNTNPYMSVVTPYLMMGEVYLNKKNYKLASTYALKALEVGKKMGAKQNICDAHGLLADIYNREEKWEDAFEHQFLFTKYKDSLLNEQVLNNINQLNTRWQVKEKDKQLAMQQLSLRLQHSSIREKNFLLIAISVFSIMILLFALIARRSYKNKQRIQEGQLEITKLKAILEGGEQERKRIAIELHDGIVSQLMAIKMMFSSAKGQHKQLHAIHSDSFEKGIYYLDQTMQDLRITAHNLSAVTVLKYGLSVALEDFCMRMDRNKITKIIFQSYGDNEPANYTLILSVYRMVQELVQNALKHAKAQQILVQLNKEADLLGITVEDDGCGFDKEEAEEKKGIGLSGLKDRVKAFKGSISIQTGATGSSFYIEFKYNDLV